MDIPAEWKEKMRLRGGDWFVYVNRKIGHVTFGLHVYLQCGPECTFTFPPNRYPTQSPMGVESEHFVLCGRLNLQTWEVEPWKGIIRPSGDRQAPRKSPADFFESQHCRSRLHCRSCRTDEKFRGSIRAAFGLPDGFPCPIGLTEGDFEGGATPKVVADALDGNNAGRRLSFEDSVNVTVMNAERRGSVTADFELRRRRMGICRECADFQVSLNRCASCGCSMLLKVSLVDGKCPKGKW